jgi:hypothetical protein
MGGHRHASKRPTRIVDPKLPQAILETERVLKEDKPVCNTGDDITLEFHEDGYPNRKRGALAKRLRLRGR